MKNLTLFVLLLISSAVMAQKVNQQKFTMSLGPQNAYYVEIEGADKDLLEDTWKEYVKEYGKVNHNKKAKEFVSEKVVVTLINGSTPLTLYAKFEEGNGLSTTYLWVDLGTGFSNAADFSAQNRGVETFLWDFWVMARKNVVKRDLEKEEKKLKSFEKELSKLENKNKDYHADIEKARMKIAENEKNIEVNIKDQDTKKAEIELQKKTVQAVIDKLNGIGKSQK
jgi:uncharacterized protein YeeX (DUF496 family)